MDFILKDKATHQRATIKDLKHSRFQIRAMKSKNNTAQPQTPIRTIKSSLGTLGTMYIHKTGHTLVYIVFYCTHLLISLH